MGFSFRSRKELRRSVGAEGGLGLTEETVASYY